MRRRLCCATTRFSPLACLARSTHSSNGTDHPEGGQRIPILPKVPEGCDWEAFRRHGHEVVDYKADYHKALGERKIPVRADVQPGFLSKALGAPSEAPVHPSPFSSVLHDFDKHIVPGMVHWQHPDFFAFFPAQVSAPALLGELLAGSVNQPGFNWMCSPAASELEIIVTDWITKAFNMPEDFLWSGSGGMVLQPTATESAIVVMVAARNRMILRGGVKADINLSKMVAYASDQAHFCVEKACRILGVEFRKVSTVRTSIGKEDGNMTVDYPMAPGELERMIVLDVANGLTPFFVSANFGSTGICAVDPLGSIGAVCAMYGLWFNIDAAYAGVVAICPEMRGMMAGVELADSVLINGHKWLSMIFGTAFMFFKDKSAIVRALNATGEYLVDTSQQKKNHLLGGHVTAVDFKDYHLGLGRPFRSLKVYSVIKSLGISGLQDVIRRHVMLAQYLGARLQAPMTNEGNVSLLELPVQPRFGLVCFRLRGQPNAKQLELLAELNASNKMFLVHSVVEESVVLRIALASANLTVADMDRLADLVLATAEHVMLSSRKVT